MSCSSGDVEEPVHTPWLQAAPGKKQLSGQHSVVLQEQRPRCTVPHEQAVAMGGPRRTGGF